MDNQQRYFKASHSLTSCLLSRWASINETIVPKMSVGQAVGGSSKGVVAHTSKESRNNHSRICTARDRGSVLLRQESAGGGGICCVDVLDDHRHVIEAGRLWRGSAGAV